MLDTGQLEHFLERQAESLMDVCRRLVYTPSINDYNEEMPDWVEDTTDIVCGLDQRPGSERGRASDTLIQYDATIRLQLSEIWDVRDQIKITERFGETITPIIYNITGPIQRGPSGIRLLLSKVSV